VIAQLCGALAQKAIDHVVIDVGGVGFHVIVSLQTLASLPQPGERVTLLTYLAVREDALTLYGFFDAAEREAFELCLSVQGIGPKLAMSILSTYTPSELAAAVRGGDVARLQRIPGIGKKTAERIALELRDKFDRVALPARAAAGPMSSAATAQVVSALTNLGYRPHEVERVVDEIAARSPGTPVPELIKKALRALAE
jgi:Holliday junction DNA helicase RuvA